VPRDRASTFEPQLIAKGQTHFTGFDDKILSLYARGMTVREIQGHLAELYATDVSPDLISRVSFATARPAVSAVDVASCGFGRPLPASAAPKLPARSSMTDTASWLSHSRSHPASHRNGHDRTGRIATRSWSAALEALRLRSYAPASSTSASTSTSGTSAKAISKGPVQNN
jgi:hypothetical protein